ncbi:MAG TPA: hypothetical protein VHM89_08550 [Acidimicrobiales bacterium]|nr:hypothetical protein [Acidimicrobiales bacterium]
MTPMVVLLLPLVLTAVTLVAVVRMFGEVADEAGQLRVALVRVGTLRPMVREISVGARRLSAGIAELGA